jgi:hypothetical protein
MESAEVITTSSPDHPVVRPSETPEAVVRKQRSRLTNGSALLPGVDGRSPWVRRCKDVIAAHLSDLGGEDNTSAAERSIIRRASVMTVELERMEAQFAAAGEASPEALDIYARISANLRRMLEAVGLKRVPREVQTLDSYLASNTTETNVSVDGDGSDAA